MPWRKNLLAAQILASAIDYGIISMDLDGLITSWNDGAHKLLGWTEEEMLGESASNIFIPEDRAAGKPRVEMENALISGRGLDERWHVRKDGSRFWASGEMMPLKDEQGSVVGFIKILRDRTHEHAVEKRLKENEANMRLIANALPVGIAYVDRRERYIFVNRLYELSLAPEGTAMIGRPASEVLNAEQYAVRKPMIDKVLGGECVRFDATWVGRQGLQLVWDTQYIPRYDEYGEISGYFVLAADVTRQKASEELQATLNHELGHRMKNLLTMVQAIVNQTLRQVSDNAIARDVVAERIAALSDAHETLISGGTEGASVQTIVENSIRPLGYQLGERITVAGPDLELSATAALSLSMVLHELTTNALKYGSLSVETGRIFVTWSVEDVDGEQAFEISWSETGGPKVTAPLRKGFGSKLIAGGISGASSRVEMSYDPSGFICRIQAALTKLDKKN